MERAKIFTNNRSQAVRLPKAVAFPKHVREVEIVAVGDTRVIRPVGERWKDFFEREPLPPEDWIPEREQPPDQERDPF
jgi:antitoxin VapB